MAFEVKNPTLKNIIVFLRSLSNVATDQDISIGDTSNYYGRKNGTWSQINAIEITYNNSTETLEMSYR